MSASNGETDDDEFEEILSRIPREHSTLGDIEMQNLPPPSQERLQDVLPEPPLMGPTHIRPPAAPTSTVPTSTAPTSTAPTTPTPSSPRLPQTPLPTDIPHQQQQQDDSPSNGWDEKIENIMRSLAKKAYLNRQLHDVASNENARKDRRFKFALMGVAFASSIFAFLPKLITSPWDPIPLLAKALITTVTAMTVANTILNYDKLTQQHRQAERRYLELYQQLQIQLIISDPKLRINGIMFLKLSMQGHTQVQNKSPPIPPSIIKLWKEKAQHVAAEQGEEFRDVQIAVSPDDVPVLRRVDADGRQQFIIQIDPISELTLQEIIDTTTLL